MKFYCSLSNFPEKCPETRLGRTYSTRPLCDLLLKSTNFVSNPLDYVLRFIKFRVHLHGLNNFFSDFFETMDQPT